MQELITVSCYKFAITDEIPQIMLTIFCLRKTHMEDEHNMYSIYINRKNSSTSPISRPYFNAAQYLDHKDKG